MFAQLVKLDGRVLRQSLACVVVFCRDVELPEGVQRLPVYAVIMLRFALIIAASRLLQTFGSHLSPAPFNVRKMPLISMYK